MSMTDATVSPSAAPVPSRSPESDKTQPLWYDPPRHPFWCLCFKALCLIAISKPSVDHWDDLINGRKKEEWVEHKKMVTDRLGNMNVTAGLVLTTSAVFISTQPPFQPLMPYASHGELPDLLLQTSLTALISLMTGTSVLIIYDTCYGNADMKRILKSLKRSRLRLICSLILMAYPSLALAVSTMALLTAVFIAGFTSDKLFVKILTAVTYLTLVFLAVLAVYVFSAPWFDMNDPDPADSHDRPSSEPKGDSVVFHREIEYSGSRIKPRRKELV
ncbi:hypothetical protein EV424DRAFT_1606009 [Suillus variegatus]|nr:hypothetical protein EV424DRAFT_1606009 [Suillus variegatus]